MIPRSPYPDDVVAKQAIQSGRVGQLSGRLSFVERLENEKQHLEQRLRDIDAALAALTESPAVLKAVEAIDRLGHI